MSTTPEQAVAALFARLTPPGAYKTASRRLRDPEGINPDTTPRLMLVEHRDVFKRPSPSLPPVHEIILSAIIYTDVGDDDNAIPSSTINALLQQMKDALAPDTPASGKCTLGGLVDSATIDGDTIRSPGDITGKSLAIVPIRIVLP